MKLSDLTQDPKNANKGTFRGRCAVERSLADLGAGRSIVTDKNGVILAGNKTAAAAQSVGIDEDVIVVQTDGTKLVVVQRTDLDANDAKAKKLAVADNRAAEVGLEWDPEVLKDISVDLMPYFTPAELQEITDPDAVAPTDQTSKTLPSGYGVMIENISEQQQLELLERLSAEGYSCRALTF
jgi:hypothetical protein